MRLYSAVFSGTLTEGGNHLAHIKQDVAPRSIDLLGWSISFDGTSQGSEALQFRVTNVTSSGTWTDTVTPHPVHVPSVTELTTFVSPGFTALINNTSAPTATALEEYFMWTPGCYVKTYESGSEPHMRSLGGGMGFYINAPTLDSTVKYKLNLTLLV